MITKFKEKAAAAYVVQRLYSSNFLLRQNWTFYFAFQEAKELRLWITPSTFLFIRLKEEGNTRLASQVAPIKLFPIQIFDFHHFRSGLEQIPS